MDRRWFWLLIVGALACGVGVAIVSIRYYQDEASLVTGMVRVQALRITAEASLDDLPGQYRALAEVEIEILRASTWDEIRHLHTQESLAWAEESGAAEFFNNHRRETAGRELAISILAVFHIRVRDQRVGVLVVVPIDYSGPIADAPMWRPDFFRFEDGTWVVDRMLNATALGTLFQQTRPGDLSEAIGEILETAEEVLREERIRRPDRADFRFAEGTF